MFANACIKIFKLINSNTKKYSTLNKFHFVPDCSFRIMASSTRADKNYLDLFPMNVAFISSLKLSENLTYKFHKVKKQLQVFKSTEKMS